jgi:hypothetical protein
MNRMFVEGAGRGGRLDALARLGLVRSPPPADSDQGAEQPLPASFDGGVRGRHSPPQRGLGQESASSLFVRAMQASRQQRREREADEGQTIYATNI